MRSRENAMRNSRSIIKSQRIDLEDEVLTCNDNSIEQGPVALLSQLMPLGIEKKEINNLDFNRIDDINVGIGDEHSSFNCTDSAPMHKIESSNNYSSSVTGNKVSVEANSDDLARIVWSVSVCRPSISKISLDNSGLEASGLEKKNKSDKIVLNKAIYSDGSSVNALLSPRIGFRSSKSLTSRQSSSFASTIEDEEGLVQINQYTVMEELGRGSYGSVKLVEDQNKRKYALKIISKKKLMKSAGYFRRPPPLRNSSSSFNVNPQTSSMGSSIDHNAGCHSLASSPSTRPSTASVLENLLPGSIDSSDISPTKQRQHHKQRDPIQRIYQEIAIHKKLDHPNIVKLYEVIDERDQPNLYMIFEYIEGGPVMDVGQSDPLSEEIARNYFRDILRGLDYLHFNKIIHRDIKPSNLLVDKNGTVKMIDFGVSCQFTGDDIFLRDTLGSPAFLAPEVVQEYSSKFTGKALDIWALGMTLYCFLFGRVAYDSHNKFDLYHMIATKPMQFPSEPTISEESRDLLKKMLNKNPKYRIKLKDIMMHSWVTKNETQSLFDGSSTAINCNKSNATHLKHTVIEVTDAEVAQCTVRPIKFETIVSAIMIARRRSFRQSRISKRNLYGNSGTLQG